MFLLCVDRGLLEHPRFHPIHRGAPGVSQADADFFFQSREPFPVDLQPRWIIHDHLAGATAGEHSVQCVEVLLADRIELVVVTAGARNGQAEKGFREHIDLVVDHLHLIVQGIHRDVPELHHAQVRRPNPGFIQAFGAIDSRVFQEIPGDVFADQLVIGNVRVEGAYEIIPVAPGHGQFRITLTPMRFAVADQVHPVPRPTLAKTGRGQQSVHPLLVGVGRAIAQKVFDLFHRRRQPGQCERHAAQQRFATGFWGRSQSAFLHVRQQEAIHRVVGPRGVRDARDGRHSHRAKTPPLLARLDRGGKTGAVSRRGWRHGLRLVAGIHSTCVHPPGKIRDDGLGELRPILGHSRIGVRVSDAFEEKALSGVSRDDGGT